MMQNTLVHILRQNFRKKKLTNFFHKNTITNVYINKILKYKLEQYE